MIKNIYYAAVFVCCLKASLTISTIIHAASTCLDNLSNCPIYTTDVCLNKTYLGWAHDNCKRFCGFCDPWKHSVGFYGKCVYKGSTYATGQSWDIGCDYTCTCADQSSGRFTCHNKCPVYINLHPQCTLEKESDQCCKIQQKYRNECRASPVDFSMMKVYHYGIGTVSGLGFDKYHQRSCHELIFIAVK